MIAEGAEAPEFTLQDQDGSIHHLKDYLGSKVVLYFYPRDNTPGCTREAQAFRDKKAEFDKYGVVILGMSGDSEKSHKKFCVKQELNFTLLSDPDKHTIDSYGAMKNKSMYGKTFLGIQRSTVIIDEKGFVLKVYPNVKPDGHADEILSYLNANSEE